MVELTEALELNELNTYLKRSIKCSKSPELNSVDVLLMMIPGILVPVCIGQ